MKISKLVLIPALLCGTLMLARCGGQVQVYNVTNYQIPHLEEKHPNTADYISLADIQKALILSAKNTGWLYTISLDTGMLHLNKTIGEQLMSLNVVFTRDEYSLTYVRSSNLNYNSKDNSINADYNDEVEDLQEEINKQLVLMKSSNEPNK